MQPDQSHQPDYSFIMNPSPAPKKSLFGGGRGFNQRLMVVIGGGAVLLIVIILLFSFIFGGSDNTQKLVSIVAKQAELARISEIAEKDATSSDTRNYASTVRLSMTSAQSELTALLTKQGRKVGPKEIAAGQNKQTDELLTEAKQANRFDEVFNETIQAGLAEYQQDLSDAFSNTSSASARASLKHLYDSAAVLTGKE